MRRASFGLTALMALSLVGCDPRYRCSSDSQCEPGWACVTWNINGTDDRGSACQKLCAAPDTSCPADVQCGSCPESPQRCWRTDGGPVGPFCATLPPP